MNFKQIKGFAVVAILPYLVGILVVAGGYKAYKVIEPGRNKDVANQIAVATAKAEAEAKEAKDKANELQKAIDNAVENHKKLEDVHNQVDKNTSGFIEGGKIALDADPNPSQASIVARGLLESASQALGQPLTPEQKAMWIKTVAGLIAKNAEAQEKIEQLTQDAIKTRASLEATKQHADASDITAQKLSVQLAEQTKELVKTNETSTNLANQNKNWANNEQTLWGRIKALGGLVIILGIVAFLIGIKFLGVKETLIDAVSLGEHVKNTAIKAGHDAVEMEKEISDWWGKEEKDKLQVDKIREKLRI